MSGQSGNGANGGDKRGTEGARHLQAVEERPPSEVFGKLIEELHGRGLEDVAEQLADEWQEFRGDGRFEDELINEARQALG